MRDIISNEYGLTVERWEKIGRYDTFIWKNYRYILVPALLRTEAEISELQQMSAYLSAKGDVTVATFVPTRTGTLMTHISEQPVVILRTYVQSYTRQVVVGRELAKLHHRGRLFPVPVVHCKRIGQWKELWGKRLDQMEEFWRSKTQLGPEDAFDRLFIESFPYYIGLTENAIQYVADTELDEVPSTVDSATICHERLPNALWVEGKESKLAIDWVYDHCARDLAEWVRHMYVKRSAIAEEEIRQFFREYEHTTPLSAFSWRLIYARLLFPLHYFECIEGYYVTEHEEEKKKYEQTLITILDRSREYERFLGSFYDLLELSSRRWRLPKIGWLSYA
ncbi:spore coat putative kinase YutH [Thermaerobacillus caldiproteolyticus]|uniref:Spore coat protein YutH n=1 Tax=Thermaerobacillus caldiproteolyticus TaxID=247480 RepID=A0A7W0BZI0_9BACL|nr:spore coat protein YutH [Anoxybacillus caldiproteolyticus]MBA2875635.1 spore coat protein YutH [Anoxybacillus caldiproteolyticus]